MKKNILKTLILFICFIIISTNFASHAENTIEENTNDLNEITSDNSESIDELPAVVQNMVDSLPISDRNLVNESPSSNANAENYFEISQDDIVINTTVNGDVYVFTPGSVTINSTVLGNVFAMASDVNISEHATINSSVFSISQTFNLSGKLEKNAYIICQDFTSDNLSSVDYDLFLLAQNVNLTGKLNRNAYISCDELKVSELAHIVGNLTYSSKNKAEISPDVVSGKVTFNQVTEDTNNNKKEAKTFSITNLLWSIVSFIVVALIIYFIENIIVPNLKEKSIDSVTSLGKSFILGVLALFITPIACIVLLFPIITGVLSLILLMLYIIMLIIGSRLFINTLSVFLADKYKDSLPANEQARPIVFIVFLSIIYQLIKLIPVLGALTTFVVTLLGFGVFIINCINKPKE